MTSEVPSTGLEWSNLTLGCWAVIAPFVLGFGSAQGPMWTHVVIGVCVATIAAIQLVASGKSQVPSRTKSEARR